MIRRHDAEVLVRDFMQKLNSEPRDGPEEWTEDSIFDFHSDEGGIVSPFRGKPK